MKNNKIPPLTDEDWERLIKIADESHKDAVLLGKVVSYLAEMAS